ncbi:hypothetical protein BJY52DRAFT_1228855 [Lactarius psammicola]|nr:hypothetical protein BJY52DRAFT_1228855 [Lactarius psammicola]
MCKFGLDSANAPPSPVPELQAASRPLLASGSEGEVGGSQLASNQLRRLRGGLPAHPSSERRANEPCVCVYAFGEVSRRSLFNLLTVVFDRNHDEVHEILTYVEKGSRHTIATFMSAVELFIALDTERPKRRGCVRVIENARALVVGERTFTSTLWFNIDARELEVSGAQGTSPPPDDPIHRLQGKRAAGAMATSEILVTSPSPSNLATCWLVGEGITRSDPGPRPRTPSPGPEDDPPQALTPEPEQEQLPMALLDRLAEDDKIIYYCVALLCCCVMVYSLFPASAYPLSDFNSVTSLLDSTLDTIHGIFGG